MLDFEVNENGVYFQYIFNISNQLCGRKISASSETNLNKVLEANLENLRSLMKFDIRDSYNNGDISMMN